MSLVRPFTPETVSRGAALVRGGDLVAVATETVYGLAADAGSASAVARIYAAKGRPSFNPLIVHVDSLAAAERLAVFDAPARAVATAMWPGPLTLVLPARADNGIASLVTAGLGTIAIRVPAHPTMRALLAASGRPLAAPSANASGRISPTRAAHVAASLAGRVPLIIDSGPTDHGLESTVVAVEQGRLVLLRPGPVTPAQITAVCPLPLIGPDTKVDDRPIAPGQLSAHYAPGKPLRLDALAAEPDEWLIGFGPVAGDATLSAAGSLEEAAARLFDLLHAADASPRSQIAVAPIPAGGLGDAIRDRLARAAVGSGGSR